MNTSMFEQEYTILRIKRKREDEVPDVLVVDKKGQKRRKSGLNVFQFAETVDEATWKQLEQEELRKRISVISKSGPKNSQRSETGLDTSNPELISRQASTQSNAPARQYRVIAKDEPQPDRNPSGFSQMPPKVRSTKELEKASSKIKIYDAELAPPMTEVEVDSEMEKFQALLKDYLSVDDNVPIANGAGSSTSFASVPPSTPGEYVYDIFYHRPSTLSEQAIATNLATVTGLPPAFDDEDEPDSDSEVEDEADEDSNEENFYKNDYPDEEESSEADSDGSVEELYSEDDFDHLGRFEPGY